MAGSRKRRSGNVCGDTEERGERRDSPVLLLVIVKPSCTRQRPKNLSRMVALLPRRFVCMYPYTESFCTSSFDSRGVWELSIKSIRVWTACWVCVQFGSLWTALKVSGHIFYLSQKLFRAFCPEYFCACDSAIRKVLAFCASGWYLEVCRWLCSCVCSSPAGAQGCREPGTGRQSLNVRRGRSTKQVLSITRCPQLSLPPPTWHPPKLLPPNSDLLWTFHILRFSKTFFMS